MITVLGDWIDDIDVYLKTVRPSPEGPWPIVTRVRQRQHTGGAGAVSAMVRAMGVNTVDVGDDRPRSVKHRHFVDGKQVFRLDEDITDSISDEDADAIADQITTDLVLVADYGKGLVTARLWKGLLGTKAKIIVDPARRRSLDWYCGAWGIIPNREESVVSSVDEAFGRCRELRRLYSQVCVKLDRDGMVFSDGDKPKHIAATCLNPVDICGAGDMVLAAVGVAMYHGLTWMESCEFANQMAGEKCRQAGATPVRCRFNNRDYQIGAAR